MSAEDPHGQGSQPVATITAAEPAQAGTPQITSPAVEPLAPLPAQAVHNLIALLSDQARSLTDHNARRVNNEGHAIVVRANTALDLERGRPRSQAPRR